MWVRLKLGFANTITKNLGTAFAEKMPRFENSWILLTKRFNFFSMLDSRTQTTAGILVKKPAIATKQEV